MEPILLAILETLRTILKADSDDAVAGEYAAVLNDIKVAVEALNTSTTLENPGLVIVPTGVSGSISSGKRSVTFTNIGTTDINILGTAVRAGLSITYTPTQLNSRLGSFTYDALTSEILITTLD